MAVESVQGNLNNIKSNMRQNWSFALGSEGGFEKGR